MATTYTPPQKSVDEVSEPAQRATTVLIPESNTAGGAARVSAGSRPVRVRDEFLSTLALDLFMVAAAFLTFGIVGVIAFGSIVAMGGLFVIGGLAILLGRWAWENSRR